MTINELFTKVTTSRIDVEAMIEQANNSENIDNADVFRHIMWHIPAGVRYTSDEDMSAAINSLVNDVAKELDVDKEEIFNEDGLITDTEKIAMSSKVEIETKPEEPSEEPSEEPENPSGNEDPKEDPSEDDEPKDDNSGDENENENDESEDEPTPGVE